MIDKTAIEFSAIPKVKEMPFSQGEASPEAQFAYLEQGYHDKADAYSTSLKNLASEAPLVPLTGEHIAMLKAGDELSLLDLQTEQNLGLSASNKANTQIEQKEKVLYEKYNSEEWLRREAETEHRIDEVLKERNFKVYNSVDDCLGVNFLTALKSGEDVIPGDTGLWAKLQRDCQCLKIKQVHYRDKQGNDQTRFVGLYQTPDNLQIIQVFNTVKTIHGAKNYEGYYVDNLVIQNTQSGKSIDLAERLPESASLSFSASAEFEDYSCNGSNRVLFGEIRNINWLTPLIHEIGHTWTFQMYPEYAAEVNKGAFILETVRVALAHHERIDQEDVKYLANFRNARVWAEKVAWSFYQQTRGQDAQNGFNIGEGFINPSSALKNYEEGHKGIPGNSFLE